MASGHPREPTVRISRTSEAREVDVASDGDAPFPSEVASAIAHVDVSRTQEAAGLAIDARP